ncbi:MAG TPA: BTAD domain-containing putative transcriptional regulator, partial [Pseudonocardia sp.]|nr:BTAD domain-containing putative transcriptional regulator [Pseudonocardia sp.]
MDPKFAVLGPVQVRDSAGRQVSVGGPRPRALTCALVAEAGRVVSVDRLINRVWGDEPPPAAVGTLYAYVSQLRKLLDPDRRGNASSGVISTTGSGYLLHAAPAEVDASLFELLVERAASEQAAAALETVDRALALWRGAPYVDLGESPDLAGLTQPLVELRLRAFELRIGALLELGRTAPAATAARALVGEHPLREPYWRHLMLATYRDGHQADALAAYAECRRVLDHELGMSPDADTEALHTAILRRDPTLRPGLPEPVTVRSPATRPTDPPVGLETLIGRNTQLTRIQDALHAMAAGTGWLMVLEGEAGIGKTRLAEATRDLAEAQGIRTVWSSAMRDMTAPPLWPWEQVLRALGLPAPTIEQPGDDPAAARFRLCQRIADAILEAGRRQPLLIVLDDMQWADAPSLHVLRLLAAQLNRHRCVVVTTRRTGDSTVDPTVESTVAALDREHTVRRVPIPPLTPDQVAALLGRYASSAGVDPAALHRRTGGNLFYLVELVRFYQGRAGVGEEVPSSVQAVVEQRHDQLPEDTRRVLRLAALGGQDLDLRVLAHAQSLDAAALDAAAVVAALEPAQRSGLLRRDEETLRWHFAHDIARQALVSRIGPSERARLHGVLAESIDELYGADSADHLDDLAQHLFHTAHGTGSERAFVACSAAADQARAWLAPDRAARHRERALAVLPAGEQSDRRYRTLLALSEERGMAGDNGGSASAIADALALALARDGAGAAGGDSDRAGDRDGVGDRAGGGDRAGDGKGTSDGVRAGDGGTVREAAERFASVTLWTWQLPAPTEARVITALRELLAAPLHPEQRSTLLGALAQRLTFGGADPDEVERLARLGVKIARELDDTALRGQALNSYLRATWRPEREADRLAAAEEALSLVGKGL